MASKPLRPCRHPGCRRLTSSGYCDEHKPRSIRGESAAWHGLYSRPEWQRLRKAQLLAEPWCRECESRGVRTRATVVDHIVPHRGDLRLFLAPGNLQSLCKRCHDRKTLAEQRTRKSPESAGAPRR